MYAVVGEIRSQLGPAVVLVAHDRREASVLADSIAVLDSGRILLHGPGYLLVRQEAVRLVPGGTGGADGAVVSLMSTGAHTPVRLHVEDPSPGGAPQALTAEVAGTAGRGRTGVLLPGPGVWAVTG